MKSHLKLKFKDFEMQANWLMYNIENNIVQKSSSDLFVLSI